MKLQILILAILLAIAQALFPTKEHHQLAYYDRRGGCYYGQCWAYCADLGFWCYTKKSVSSNYWGRIPCTGTTYNDPSCPVYHAEIALNNCDSGCFVV